MEANWHQIKKQTTEKILGRSQNCLEDGEIGLENENLKKLDKKKKIK